MIVQALLQNYLTVDDAALNGGCSVQYLDCFEYHDRVGDTKWIEYRSAIKNQ